MIRSPERAIRADLSTVNAILHRDEAALTRFPRDDEDAARRFVEFAKHHRIAGHLHRRLTADGHADALPARVTERLANWFDDQAAIAEHRLEEARSLEGLFRNARVEVVFLKGPFLARRYYDDWRDRFTWDTDLLIRDVDDLPRARDVIEAAGYVETSRTPFGDRALHRFTHDVEFARDGVPLDVHWAFGNHFTFRLDYERIWHARQRLELEGATYSVLDPEDELVLTLLGIVRDVERGRLRLKSCIDVALMVTKLDSEADWAGFFERRREERLDGIARAIVGFALDLLDYRGAVPALEPHLDPGGADTRAAAASRLRPSRFGVRNKAWTFRLYRGGRVTSAGWWLVSLPIRRLTHA